jgi:hypothetical protein
MCGRPIDRNEKVSDGVNDEPSADQRGPARAGADRRGPARTGAVIVLTFSRK